jgi:NifU-like protein involved in Fe-S cluster formation
MWLFWSKQENMILQEYSKNPVCNIELKDFTIQYHEWNFICWDDITVFLKIEWDKVIDYGYTGNLSTVSLASAGFLSEFLFDVTLNDILWWNYEFLSDKGFEVSTKRKRASVLPILALRNAIHQYLSDWKTDDFDDLIDE